MSRYASLECLDCLEQGKQPDDYETNSINHGHEAFRVLLKRRPLLETLAAELCNDWDCWFGYMCSDYHGVRLGWFLQHKGHRIRIHDEYGEHEEVTT